MFQIDCPYCGLREQTEFTCHGQAHIARPEQPEQISDKEWGDYIFYRTNPKGDHYERWVHSYGCKKWFNVVRNTSTDKIYASYKVGEQKPKIT